MEQAPSNHVLSREPQPVFIIALPPLLPEAIETVERLMQEHGGNVTYANGTTIFYLPARNKAARDLAQNNDGTLYDYLSRWVRNMLGPRHI